MIVADWRDGQPGELSHRVWSDLDDIDAFWSMPEDAMHRNTALVIQSYFEQHGNRLKTAVVCPPDLHGKGRGPGKKTSILLPVLIESIQEQGVAFYLNSGTNTCSWVHIDDLMQIYLSLVEAAAAGGEGAKFMRYMFTSNGRTRADRSRKVLGYTPMGDSLWKTLEEDVVASVAALEREGKI